MSKTLTKFLMLVVIIVTCQFNHYNYVLAEDISTVPKIQTISNKDEFKDSAFKDESKVSYSDVTNKNLVSDDKCKSINKTNAVQNESNASKIQNITKNSTVEDTKDSSTIKDDLTFSSNNLDNENSVSVNKVWEIQFSQKIDPLSVKSSVKIIDKNTNKEVPINVSLERNNFYINISPVSSYSPESYYVLNINSNLKSIHNKYLKNSYNMTFKTSSIISIDDINVSINQGDSYKLPDKVTANMYSGEKKQLEVIWDKSFNNSNLLGSYLYYGTVEGYEKKVNLKLTVNASVKAMVNSPYLWIWQLQDQVDKYGGIDGLISNLKSLGINNVCIKYNEGERSVSTDGINFKGDFLKYVDNFKQAGFKVGTWGYNHFDDVEDEANLIIDAINHSDYYVFDGEDAVVGKSSQAQEICELIRSKCPNALIGYTSFPIVSYHEDIPYSVFNKYCDFSSPQCYWGEMKWSAKACIDKMIEDYKNYGLDKPIYPLIQSYSVDYSDYLSYLAYKFKCTGIWSLDDIGSTCEKFLNDEINNLNSGN